MKRTIQWIAFALILALSGCTAPAVATTSPTQEVAATEAPTATVTAIPTATTIPTRSLWIDPAVPDSVREAALNWPNVRLADDPEQVDLSLKIVGDDQPALSQWVYALVAPFYTLTDEVSANDLRAAWQGELVEPFADSPLMISEQTQAALTALWGPAGDNRVNVLPEAEIVEVAWQQQTAWAVVPFELLEPRWKVLTIDGQNPVEKSFSAADYTLTVNYGIVGSSEIPGSLPAGNRDPEKMTTMVMTGVTALVRATAYKMDTLGVTYPAQDIGAWLREADIAHISNEVSFFKDCPDASPEPGPLFFCSKDSYIGLFEDVGADVIELTGNHNNDSAQVYGVDVVPFNLEMYDQRGMQHYAGGRNLEEARQPAFQEDHGNQFAFIGCNPAGPDYAWAYEAAPGAAPCEDYQWMKDEISHLKSEGYIPIATFQYFENYSNVASEQQRIDFRGVADAGAAIVQGSQAHTPKEMEFYQGSFIHYGLGNLFFDQMHRYEATLPMPNATNWGTTDIPTSRMEFLDRHVFYDGRHISTQLLTAMLEDYARPRPMTAEERAVFLSDIFKAAGW